MTEDPAQAPVPQPGAEDGEPKSPEAEGAMPLKVMLGHAARIEHIGVPKGVLGREPAGELLAPLDLKTLILLPATPLAVRDAAWAYIAEQVRALGGDWNLIALAAAYPRLRQAAWSIKPGKEQPASVTHPIHKRLIVEFFGVLSERKPDGTFRLDITAPHIAVRAVDQAKYHTRKYFERAAETAFHEKATFDKTIDLAFLATRPLGRSGVRDTETLHTDYALYSLVNDTRGNRGGSRLTLDDAELVARTRYEYTTNTEGELRTKTIQAAAAERGIPATAAAMRHKRAIDLIAVLLGHTPAAQGGDPPPSPAQPPGTNRSAAPARSRASKTPSTASATIREPSPDKSSSTRTA
ncbi:hypothetical protein [Longispora albida]|uniref:hypothetical protein n=1 Tax=Longispora albida TaxID=203523 RepID=UPI00039C49F5|nr:hypothetical protein [Longispora albida]